jgi:hypothetical protein
MTRFAWLQTRTQTLGTWAALAGLAVAATVTGIQLSHLYSTLVGHCQVSCGLATADFASHQRFLQHALDLLAEIAPALLGAFWGAPLIARELETGTFRLAWTQSVPRSRWLLTKLAVGALATAATAGALTLTVTWWYRALDTATVDRYAVFDRRGLVPVAYALFAFAIGALLGAVVRRTVPAMAATLGGYAVSRVAVTLWVRPQLLSPLHRSTSLLDTDQFGFMSDNGGPVHLVAQGTAPPNSWRLASQFVDASGHRVGPGQLAAWVHRFCPAIAAPPTGPVGKRLAPPGGPQAFEACRAQAAKVFHLLVTYQPANRYWTFQGLETAIFVAVALLAAGGCYWKVARRTG